jgi:hypothetical protein
MQCWIEECWYDQRPELEGDAITKHDMILLAAQKDADVLDLLVATQTIDDADLVSTDLKDLVYHVWTLHLQDYEDWFEAEMQREAREALTDRMIATYEAA